MILPVYNLNNKLNTGFTSKGVNEEELKKHPVVLKNNLPTRMAIEWDKFTNALTMYPARGLKGSRNSNFYEFLTMGTIPYVTGSLTLMAVFNGANKWFLPLKDRAAAKIFGNKMALGVLFYGIAKNFSKGFVTKPVKWFTGVDTEEPYVELKYKLPEHINDTDITSLEYHKVLESLEFPRWDVKYGDEKKGEARNVWYDKIAKKIGLGTNLNDSDQEVKPRVKEIAAKVYLAKAISSYLWAAAGVGLALQNSWNEFFDTATFKPWKGKPFINTCKKFFTTLYDSAIQMYKGQPKSEKFLYRHNGKILLGAAALSTLLGITNALISNQKPSKVKAKDVIEQGKTYVEN